MTAPSIKEALEHLIGSSEAFLNYFNPFNLASDKENQWHSVNEDIARAKAALATLSPPAGELSGISGELRDAVAEAIRGDGSDLCDAPWNTLSDENKIGWRGDADRAIAAFKKNLKVRNSPPAGERREAIKALAHRFWSIRPREIMDMEISRKQFYEREMTELLASVLVQDEAAIRADEREKCAKIADDARDNSDKASNPYDGGSGSLGYESACTDIAAAIRTGRDGGEV